MSFVRNQGKMVVHGREIGLGFKHHLKQLVGHLIPDFDWNIYSNAILDGFCDSDYVGIAGPASTGKSFTLAALCYAVFCSQPNGTSIILASTTLPMLKRRIWNSLVRVVEEALKKRDWLPRYWSASPLALYAEPIEVGQARSAVNAIFGVACESGDTLRPISNLVGVKNKTVIAVFDEANLMPRDLLNADANLSKNPRFKFIVVGNPTGRYDALGVMCEPHRSLGGWDAYQPIPETRIWKTTRGLAVQLSGLDTPNREGDKKRPWLISLESIAKDRELYGEDSWQYLAMNAGVFPRSENSRRVITRAICEANNAFSDPVWGDGRWVEYVGADLAFTFEDGDRSCLVRIRIGRDMNQQPIVAVVDGPVLLTPRSDLIEDGTLVPLERQLARLVAEYCQRHNIPPHRFGYDATGRGTFGVELAATWQHGFHPIEFGGRPENRPTIDGMGVESEKYAKKVSALWFAWRTLIIRGVMRSLPRTIADEGEMREYLITPNNKEDVEPKYKTRQRLGRSPDAADALCAAIETARLNGFSIGRSSNSGVSLRTKLRQSDQRWREVLAQHQFIWS